MGCRKVIATSSDRIDSHRTVYRLKIQKPSILDYIPNMTVRSTIESLVNFFLSLKAIYPDWFLPPTVILKKRKPDWDNEFETEKRMYRHLKPLQGTFIPQFYREAIYDRSPALETDDHILEAKLKEAFKALSKYGVSYGDPELHNIFELEDRVMIVDLEQAEL
ncbi:7057c26d-10e9-4b37-b265-2e75a618539d [Sclerotinia trifoliorum]|uniref:7057c26d-10e9-4b37-b265-2e75a618539d n=1 Tax=Sclerotinia trifoliorum TaxID=28548 RepID=A0A8H2ZLG2_9HELO|nr:7057c26d-10e9-4b37-b265-2e75a618539d [Sclerotinia trifoliorum]